MNQQKVRGNKILVESCYSLDNGEFLGLVVSSNKGRVGSEEIQVWTLEKAESRV